MKKVDRDRREADRLGLGDPTMTETSDSAIRKQQKKDEKESRRGNFGWEMFNSESSYRSYDKMVSGLPSSSSHKTTSTYDPTNEPVSSSSTTSSGVTRMANDLKARAAVSKRRHRTELDGEDVLSINERNKVFNKKIKRTFDKYTAEIRQNLERGTAL